MDAPNAPNPANPNAQDQFVDAVQGPANQVQGPAQIDQNVPMQPPQQPAPVQPIPIGPAAPALKYFIKIG